MTTRDFYGMTVDPVTGKTYWQQGRYATVTDLIKHVKRYVKGSKHLVVYKMGSDNSLKFVDHMNEGTY